MREFSKIEEYETTDPEKAERIKIVKQALKMLNHHLLNY